jgi:hypothetical protein
MNPFPEPPSWLKLEQHALGELSPEEAASVERGLDDPATRACRQLIDAKVRLRPLAPATLASIAARAWWLAPLAAAAALVLFITFVPRDGSDPKPPRTKGGDAAIALVREREGVLDERPSQFAAGDRFKVLLTCAPGSEGVWEIVVFQAGRAFFPLDAARVTACGNALPIDGAFGIDGAERAKVCAVRVVPGRARSDLERAGEDALGEGTPCTVLESAR